MDSMYLLVMDASPENVETIKSSLRNSGINIHMLQADNPSDCDRLLREYRPVLAVFHPGSIDDLAGLSVERATELAERHGVPLAVRYSPEAPEAVLDVLDHANCFALRSDRNTTFATLVERLAGIGQADQAQTRLAENAAELSDRFDVLLDSMSEPVAYVHEGLHVRANPAYLDLIGVDAPERLASLSLLEVMDSDESDLKSLLRDMGQGQFPAASCAVRVRTPSGETFEASADFQPVRYDAEACVQLLLRRHDDVAELRASLDRARQTDPVTQLMARHVFVRRLNERLQVSGDGADAVILIQPDSDPTRPGPFDLDGRDRLARAISCALEAELEDEDLLARIAEFSFCACVSRDDPSRLQDLAERLQAAAMRAGQESEGTPQDLSFRAGFTTLGAENTHAADAVRRARDAWTQAARQGDTSARYRPQCRADGDGTGDAGWSERIRYALDNDDFYSVQYALIHLDGDSEGLFENRTWLHQAGGDVGPEEYLSAAERTDLASTIDRHVIPGLLRAASGEGDRHIISLSGNTMQDFSFPSWFARQIKACEVEGSQLILQLALHAVEADPKSAIRLVEELTPLGCTISLADMDDSDSALTWLQELKPAIVKLRPALVHALKADPGNQAVVRSLVGAAEACGAEVIAGEVADSADMAALWQCGVKRVGGAFLQEPPRVIGQ